MITPFKLLLTWLTLLTLLLPKLTFAATYVEIRKSGINFLIASTAVESIKKTECSYILKNSKLKPQSYVRNEVKNKLHQSDIREIDAEIPKLQQEADLFIRQQIIEFKSKTDEKTACGMVSSYAIQKFQEAEINWHKKTTN